MPYVRRDSGGRILALLRESAPDAEEAIDAGHPDVAAFLGAGGDSHAFNALDLAFVRVTEDLIYTLIEKGVLQFTDLPEDAQRKLQERSSFRSRRVRGALDLLAGPEGD